MKKDNFKIAFKVVGESAITEYRYGNYAVFVSQGKLMLDRQFHVVVIHGEETQLNQSYSAGFGLGIARCLFYGNTNVNDVICRVKMLRRLCVK